MRDGARARARHPRLDTYADCVKVPEKHRCFMLARRLAPQRDSDARCAELFAREGVHGAYLRNVLGVAPVLAGCDKLLCGPSTPSSFDAGPCSTTSTSAAAALHGASGGSD